MSHNTMKPFKSDGIKEFWDGLAIQKFLAQECKSCGEKFFPPSSLCPKCLSKDFIWFELSGRGKIYSWTEARYTRTPFYMAVIDIEEGFSRFMSRVQTEGRIPKIGDTVEVTYFISNDDPLFEFKLK